MSEQEIYERLNEVFRNVFDDDEIEVEAGTTADDIEDWDSLEHINLISAVEDEFGIRFKMGEVSSMKNVGEMVDIIKARGEISTTVFVVESTDNFVIKYLSKDLNGSLAEI